MHADEFRRLRDFCFTQFGGEIARNQAFSNHFRVNVRNVERFARGSRPVPDGLADQLRALGASQMRDYMRANCT